MSNVVNRALEVLRGAFGLWTKEPHSLLASETIVNTVVTDKRRLLKIKLKSLATEAAIIRKEEEKAKHSKRPEVQELRREMHDHRVKDLRLESRATGLAYGYIRGKKYRTIEPRSDFGNSAQDVVLAWGMMEPKIHAMICKYGSQKIPVDFVTQWLTAEPQRDLPPRKPKVPYTGPKGPVITLVVLPNVQE